LVRFPAPLLSTSVMSRAHCPYLPSIAFYYVYVQRHTLYVRCVPPRSGDSSSNRKQTYCPHYDFSHRNKHLPSVHGKTKYLFHAKLQVSGLMHLTAHQTTRWDVSWRTSRGLYGFSKALVQDELLPMDRSHISHDLLPQTLSHPMLWLFLRSHPPMDAPLPPSLQ